MCGLDHGRVAVPNMSHVVDTVQVLSPLLIVQVLPLASDNLNRILRKKESAGRAEQPTSQVQSDGLGARVRGHGAERSASTQMLRA